MYYDGSSVKTWARWIDWDIFYLAAADSTFSDPEGADDSAKWYLLDVTMDPDINVVGTAGANWSIYRFQAIEEVHVNDYNKDYRFTPSDTDVKGYIYVRDNNVHTFYPTSDYITLQGGLTSFTTSVLLTAASILAYSLF